MRIANIRRVVALSTVALQISARRWLHALHQDLGAAGLMAAASIPGVAAVLDQHAATVQEAITTGMECGTPVAGLILLASYGRGVLAEARRHGWQRPPANLAQWRRADWTSMRLAAVCALAHRPTVAEHLLPPLTDPFDPPARHGGT
jgi:hypothetical protein